MLSKFAQMFSMTYGLLHLLSTSYFLMADLKAVFNKIVCNQQYVLSVHIPYALYCFP